MDEKESITETPSGAAEEASGDTVVHEKDTDSVVRKDGEVIANTSEPEISESELQNHVDHNMSVDETTGLDTSSNDEKNAIENGVYFFLCIVKINK